MKNNNYRNNHIPLSTKYRLPYLDSVAYIITQAAQIQQINAKSDSGDVRHAEKKNIFCRSYKNLFIFSEIIRIDYMHSWTDSFVFAVK